MAPDDLRVSQVMGAIRVEVDGLRADVIVTQILLHPLSGLVPGATVRFPTAHGAVR